MNKKKSGIIAVLLVAIFGMGSLLAAGVITVPGLIQTGDYFENIKRIEVPNPSANMSLQDAELEDYYSVKVADLYQQDTNIYSAGNIEFAYNLDENNSFVDGYVTYSSDATANYQRDEDTCENQTSNPYCLSDEEYNQLTSDLPPYEETAQSEIDAMTPDQFAEFQKAAEEQDAMYENALSEVAADYEQTDAQEPFTADDVIVDYYDSVDSFNAAISVVIGTPTTYEDLERYVV